VRVLSFPLSVIAAALGFGALIVEFPNVKWWATTLQLVGAVVALVGFSSAYVRAKYGEKLRTWLWLLVVRIARWIKQMWQKYFGNPPTQHIHPMGIASGEAVGLPMVVTVEPAPLELDTSLPLPEQVDLIAKYAKAIADHIPRLNTEVQRLDGRIDTEGAGATEFTESSIAELRREVHALEQRIDWSQVLDLRWAIVGLGITVLGVFLGYWA
jgi:hypothetical protein